MTGPKPEARPGEAAPAPQAEGEPQRRGRRGRNRHRDRNREQRPGEAARDLPVAEAPALPAAEEHQQSLLATLPVEREVQPVVIAAAESTTAPAAIAVSVQEELPIAAPSVEPVPAVPAVTTEIEHAPVAAEPPVVTVTAEVAAESAPVPMPAPPPAETFDPRTYAASTGLELVETRASATQGAVAEPEPVQLGRPRRERQRPAADEALVQVETQR